MLRMKWISTMVLGCLFIQPVFAAPKTLEEVLKLRLDKASEFTRDLDTVASRNRVRAWLPSSPEVTFSSGDNNTWKAWSVSTSLPIPLKSMYRDSVELSQKKYLQAKNSYTRQELLRETIEIYLECAVPTEMSILLEQAAGDQRVVSTISNSLYASGSVPQTDRVTAELLVRQLEAQVRLQRDQASNGCIRWEKWADEENTEDDPGYRVPDDVANQFLADLNLSNDRYRELTNLRLMNLTMEKEKLWSKFVPDLELGWSRSNYFNEFLSGGPPVKYTYSWSVGIKLPFTFPFYDNTEYREQRAQLGLDKMKAELENNESDKKLLEAKTDWKRATLRLRQILSKDFALAEVLLESSLASYRAGKVGFADLVLSRRAKLDLRIEEVQLKAQRLMAKSVCLTECDKEGL